MRPLKRILHVEDVPSIQVVTRIALERLGGFEVLSCGSAQQALEQVQGFAPDMILLDVMLPEMDGMELLRQLAQRVDLRQIAVVLLTGQKEPADMEALKRLGVCRLLHKPFDPLQLAAQLKETWETQHD